MLRTLAGKCTFPARGFFLSAWLYRRLTPAKSGEARWSEFATVMERVWEEFFDPRLSRLERMRSSYLADDQDLVRKIRQMGDYFSFELPNEADRPIALAWRRLELEYKDTELILRSVFRRHFGNMAVNWFPLFAPLDKPYGSEFEAAEGPWPETKNYPPEGMFLTSRGVLGIDLGCVFRLRMSKAEFLAKAEPLLLRTKPLHIVYAGPLWYVRLELPPFEARLDICWDRAHWCDLLFAVVGSRFDVTPADACRLDAQTMGCTWEVECHHPIPLFPAGSMLRGLDQHLPEGFPAEWLPLDIALAAPEGDTEPFRLAAGDTSVSCGIRMLPFRHGMRKERTSDVAVSFLVHTSACDAVEHYADLRFRTAPWRLDTGGRGMPDGWLSPISCPGHEGLSAPFACFVGHDVAMPLSECRGVMSCEVESEALPAFPAIFNAYAGFCSGVDARFPLVFSTDSWRLDRGIGDIPDGWLPSPRGLPGAEGKSLQPACIAECRHSPSLRVADIEARMEAIEHTLCSDVSFFACADCHAENEENAAFVFDSLRSSRLDRFPRFDEVPADRFPLDMPIGGSYA